MITNKEDIIKRIQEINQTIAQLQQEGTKLVGALELLEEQTKEIKPAE
jgi:uncharacterized coiled-coil protein SlyX